MSTAIYFQDSNLSTEFLTEEDIQKRCPAAFLTEGTNGVSDKYIVARTIDVVRDLAKLGWYPVDAKQRKVTKKSSGRFNFHMIFFQNPDVKIVKTVTNSDGTVNECTDCYPRIMLSNSMDGTCAFKFIVGLFRMVCSNGLCIASDVFADMRIRHTNYSFEDLQKLINKTIEELPGQISIMNRMQEVILSSTQQKELALKMFRVRKGVAVDDSTITLDDKTTTELLTPVREEDKGNNLWLVWNVLQEKLTKGLFSSIDKRGRLRKARPVKDFVRDLALNREWWKIAESYLQTN